MSLRAQRITVAVAFVALLAPRALAHDGPPYPILVDQDCGPVVASVWADPDVGTGTFYFYLDPARGGALPATSIDLYVRPRDRAADEAHFAAVAADADQPYQMVAKVEFETREWFVSRFVLHTPEGVTELVKEVEATPPGLGKYSLLWYLLPFLGVAFLWGKAILQRRRYYAQRAEEADSAGRADEASAARD